MNEFYTIKRIESSYIYSVNNRLVQINHLSYRYNMLSICANWLCMACFSANTYLYHNIEHTPHLIIVRVG